MRLVQGFQARTVQYDDRAIEDVINAIKNVIEKVKEAISNIASQIPEIIKNIQDKIKEIIENINLPGIIAEIKEKIEKIIALGEAGKKCVEAEREQIEALVENTKAGMDACVAAAQSESGAIANQMAALLEKANEIREDITNRVVKCIEDNKLNPVGVYNCLKDQVDPVSQELSKLQQQIQQTVANAKEIAEQAAANLSKCVQNVRDETVAKQEQILSSIKECVAGSA